MERLVRQVKRTGRFWLWVALQFYKDKCLMRCSSLTFTTLLAIVPLTVVVFSALSIFPFFKEGAREFQDFVFKNFLPSAGDQIQQYIMQFEQSAHKLPVFGFIFLFVTAIMMMVTIENTLNDIWKVRYRRRVSGSILLYWAVLTLGPILLSLSLFISSYLRSMEWLNQIDVDGIQRLVFLLPFICAFLAFTFLYLVVPHCSVKLRHALAGAFVGAVLFEISKACFGYYIANFPTYSLLYGALATIPIFLLWIYISWIVFLVGAQVVNGLRLNQAKRSTSEISQFYLAYRVLYRLWQGQREGRALSLVHLLAATPSAGVVAMKAVLRQLRAKKMVQTASDDRYLLSSDLHTLTLHQLYLQLGYFLPENLDLLQNDNADVSLAKVITHLRSQHSDSLKMPLMDLFLSSKE